MAYKIFISYSTKNLRIVNSVKKFLSKPGIEVFVAEYSVTPGYELNKEIINAIKKCDLFLLIWSRQSKSSEYVQQEIGVARGYNKKILPIVLKKGLKLPAFIQDLKYLPVYRDPEGSLKWLRSNIFAQADKKGKIDAIVVAALAFVVGWLFSQK